jgi:hypothetical protein
MDKKSQKSFKIVLFISFATAVIAAVAISMLFNGSMIIGVFFGMILGFFLPWILVLLGA